MNREPIESKSDSDSGFVYSEPEGKLDVIAAECPDFRGIEEEFTWHQKQLAFRTVGQPDSREWDKESLLSAIEQGHVDAFSMNRFRFPPTIDGEWLTTFTAFSFDDREFGDRLANTVLGGFNRDPRQPKN